MSISFFGLSIHLYGVMAALGLYSGSWLIFRRTRLYRIKDKTIEYLLLWLFLGGLVGARLYHVLHYFSYYWENPMRIFRIWEGGLGIFGALIGGGLVFVLASSRYRLAKMPILDLFAPSLALGQAIGRIGNYFNSEGFGPPTTLPWGIFIPRENRPLVFSNASYFHPTFFYEALWLTIGTVFMFKLEQNCRLRSGTLFGFYLLWFGLGRFFLEFLRFDTAQIEAIRIAQVLALVAILSGSLLLTRRTV